MTAGGKICAQHSNSSQWPGVAVTGAVATAATGAGAGARAAGLLLLSPLQLRSQSSIDNTDVLVRVLLLVRGGMLQG